MLIPDWIWIVFVFAIGCCMGSFLNVVIYRLPREQSVVRPPSACPGCGKEIRGYDNIPLFSWVILGGKCRYCKVKISPRYFIIELLTGLIFAGLFVLYFHTNMRVGVKPFLGGGWFIYLITLFLVSGLIASSAIDLELWVIPLSICWFMTAVGLMGSAVGVFVIPPAEIIGQVLLPYASAKTAALALGAAVGLCISLLLLKSGVIKGSYEFEDSSDTGQSGEKPETEEKFNPRIEVGKEIVFLLPIIAFSVGAYLLTEKTGIHSWWIGFSQRPVIAGLLGSFWGYIVGCAVVWVTRILGTLGFGKEAMGLGDVHLMGAAGAVIGPVLVVVAFFVAPFFGLVWAAIQMFFKKSREIPYGPFLSLGILTVIILHDWILSYLSSVLYR